MAQSFGDDFITISDEDGIEYELEVLSSIEMNGSEYIAVIPATSEEDENEDEDLEVCILKVVMEDGEEMFSAISDEQELESVYNLLMEQIYEDDDEV